MTTEHRDAEDIVVMGVPFALGGWDTGMQSAIIDMTRTPSVLRVGGFADALGRRLDRSVRDLGDLPIDPGYCLDGTAGATNRALTLKFLPVIRDAVGHAGVASGGRDRIIVIGGECTIHPAVLAGLRGSRSRPIGLAYFDAHGDFHTSDTSTSGHLWGMPLALACGRGDSDLLDALGGPPAPEWACAHLGGQALDEDEARALASSQVAHFGPGMLSTPAGLASFSAWVDAVAPHVDGFYVAFDVDVLDESGGLSVALPEENGMPVDTAMRAIAELAARSPIVGFGVTTMALENGDADRAVRTVEDLVVSAFGAPGD